MARSTHFDHGYVVGMIITSRGDGGDENREPDAVGATNVRPTFVRKAAQYRHPLSAPDQGAHGALVQHEPVKTAVRHDGHLTSDVDERGSALAQSTPGVWLVTGVYTVRFSGHAPDFDIEVTTDHTPESPLDLYAASPWTPPPGAAVQVVPVPSGGVAGDVLTRGPGGALVWSPAPTGDGGGGTPPGRDDHQQGCGAARG